MYEIEEKDVERDREIKDILLPLFKCTLGQRTPFSTADLPGIILLLQKTEVCLLKSEILCSEILYLMFKRQESYVKGFLEKQVSHCSTSISTNIDNILNLLVQRLAHTLESFLAGEEDGKMTLWQSIKRQNIDIPLSVRLTQPTCPPMLDSEPTMMHSVGAMCVCLSHSVRQNSHHKMTPRTSTKQAGIILDSFRDQALRWAGRPNHQAHSQDPAPCLQLFACINSNEYMMIPDARGKTVRDFNSLRFGGRFRFELRFEYLLTV